MHLFIFVVPEGYIGPLRKTEKKQAKLRVKLNENLKSASLLAQFGFFGLDNEQSKHNSKTFDASHQM